jgi:endonuclease/exonuclease/phosphatase family metal-dependent hydrolase
LRILGRIITVIIAVIVTIVALAAGYMVYLNVNSNRLPDKTGLTITEVAETGEMQETGETPETGESSETGTEDGTEDDALPELQPETEYRAITYNVGFGAYNHEYSFFMSEGRIADGGRTRGIMSRADSEDAVTDNMDAAIAVMLGRRPDIALFQEVDRNAGRSYRIDEFRMISRAFGEGITGEDDDSADEYIGGIGEDIDGIDETVESVGVSVEGGSFAETYATNFHTGWLLWPPAHPIGMIRDSGIAMFSRYAVDSAERFSLPVIESFPDKFFDLDRCFTIARFPVVRAGADTGEDADSDPAGDGAAGENANSASPDADSESAELVLINVHLSAYEAGNKIRGEQMKKLAGVMEDEREKGNWVIAGGDWNQCFPDSVDAFTGRMETPAWAKPLNEDILPDNFSIVNAYNADIIATCRDSSIPWTPGVSYETIIDGWIVSDNVDAEAENIDTDYIASDHNPVLLKFILR